MTEEARRLREAITRAEEVLARITHTGTLTDALAAAGEVHVARRAMTLSGARVSPDEGAQAIAGLFGAPAPAPAAPSAPVSEAVTPSPASSEEDEWADVDRRIAEASNADQTPTPAPNTTPDAPASSEPATDRAMLDMLNGETA